MGTGWASPPPQHDALEEALRVSAGASIPRGEARQKQPPNSSSHPASVLRAKPTLPADLLSGVGQPQGQLWEMLLLKPLKVKLMFPRVKNQLYLFITNVWPSRTRTREYFESKTCFHRAAVTLEPHLPLLHS